MTIRVLLADDNALFREGIATLLGRDPEVRVIGQAKNGAEAVHKAGVLRPDVVLMDLSMPLGGGVEATRRVIEERPDVSVCMLTISERVDDLFAAIRAGARGYLLKTAPLTEVQRAVRTLAAGGSVVTPHLAARLLDEFARLSVGQPAPRFAGDVLTVREREVLELIATGDHNRDIAERLAISPHTVKVHLHNILDKLQLRNRRQAAAFAVQTGIAGYRVGPRLPAR